jgi:sialate O-acetylesterase
MSQIFLGAKRHRVVVSYFAWPFFPFCVSVLLLIFTASFAEAKVRLPSVFTDHLVLQREAEVSVWGFADAGETVTVEFAGQKKSVSADAHGNWLVKLDSLAASAESRELKVTGKDSSVKISDVLVGDVWLAGGQSNMGFPLFAAHNAKEELPKAGDPLLRFFRVKTKTAVEPQTDCTGSWELSTPDTAKNFSGVAYFFAREIRRDQKVPVAVLQAPWGGTDIETWISLDGLKKTPALTKPLERWEKALADYQKILADPTQVQTYEKELKHWQEEVAPAFNAAMKKYNEEKSAGKEVGAKPQPARPEPSNPDPMGMPSPSRRPSTPTVNFNGMIAPLVPFAVRGVIWYQGENNGARGLEYRELFPRLIEDWRNQWTKKGGADFPFLFVQLPCNGSETSPVAQSGWPWLREAQLLTLQKVPLTGMAITIDVGNPNDVHPADKIDVGQRLALVARKKVYGEDVQGSGPLLKDYKIEGEEVRVNFTETGRGLTTGTQPWLALKVQPFPTDKLIGFFIAGEDKKWIEAGAKINGDSVVVSSPKISKPVAVRYGWANSPRCNLYNKEGLPASPFRTDDWPLGVSK